MSIFSRILVAIGEDEPSREGVTLGARLARDHASQLHLCYCVDWVPLVSEAASSGEPFDTDIIVGGLEARGADLMARSAGTAKNFGVEATQHWLEGAPADAILNLAAQIESTLIVMGTHGRSGIDCALMGSVTEAVLRRSTIPVLTIRPGERLGVSAKRPFLRILVGIDDSEPSEAAVATVLDFPPEDREALLFLTAADETRLREADAQRIVDRALSAASAQHVAASGEIARGRSSDVLIAASREHRADLIVVGSHGRQGMQRLFLGSVAETLVRTAPVPVLVVRRAL
jgi:nucleotide-binding universal stress UspA family protein